VVRPDAGADGCTTEHHLDGLRERADVGALHELSPFITARSEVRKPLSSTSTSVSRMRRVSSLEHRKRIAPGYASRIHLDDPVYHITCHLDVQKCVCEERDLLHARYVLEDHHEAGVQLRATDQRQEVVAVIRDKDEVFLKHDPEELAVFESTPSAVRDMVRLVASLIRRPDERRRKALVDQKSYRQSTRHSSE
jgi:hypothetical protein